jgi:hypothetical protein
MKFEEKRWSDVKDEKMEILLSHNMATKLLEGTDPLFADLPQVRKLRKLGYKIRKRLGFYWIVKPKTKNISKHNMQRKQS